MSAAVLALLDPVRDTVARALDTHPETVLTAVSSLLLAVGGVLCYATAVATARLGRSSLALARWLIGGRVTDLGQALLDRLDSPEITHRAPDLWYVSDGRLTVWFRSPGHPPRVASLADQDLDDHLSRADRRALRRKARQVANRLDAQATARRRAELLGQVRQGPGILPPSRSTTGPGVQLVNADGTPLRHGHGDPPNRRTA